MPRASMVSAASMQISASAAGVGVPDSVCIELHELAIAARTRLFVAVDIPHPVAAIGLGQTHHSVRPHSARAALSDHTAVKATDRLHPETRTRPRWAGLHPAGTCQARRCTPWLGFQPVQSHKAHRPLQSWPACASAPAAHAHPHRASPLGSRALGFSGLFFFAMELVFNKRKKGSAAGSI